MKKLIEFKSTFDFYEKERKGIKPNTVRSEDCDERFDALIEFSLTPKTSRPLWIKIICKEKPSNYFFRKVKDVSIFECYGHKFYIISWEDQK